MHERRWQCDECSTEIDLKMAARVVPQVEQMITVTSSTTRHQHVGAIPPGLAAGEVLLFSLSGHPSVYKDLLSLLLSSSRSILAIRMELRIVEGGSTHVVGSAYLTSPFGLDGPQTRHSVGVEMALQLPLTPIADCRLQWAIYWIEESPTSIPLPAAAVAPKVSRADPIPVLRFTSAPLVRY